MICHVFLAYSVGMYCLKCAKLMVLQVPEMDERERHVCLSCGYIHYINPKIVAGVIPFWNNKILLCRRAIDPEYGKWTVPAGFMEMGETVEQGALREAKEEADVDLTISHLHVLYSVGHVGQVHLLYIGFLRSFTYSIMPETLEIDLFDFENIPWDDIAFSSVTFALQKLDGLDVSKKICFTGDC